MTDSNNDMNHAVLNLSAEEKRVFAFLFDKADTDQIGVITGERAVAFFERTGVQPQVLGEIWQIADTENRGFLSRPGFAIVLRLIGHCQAGRSPSSELAFKTGPLPRFEGLQIPSAPAAPAPQALPTGAPLQTFATGVLQPQTSGIRIPPLDPQKVAQYSGLFERSGAQNGLLDGLTAKSIFERAGLPVETLGKIWTLADREQRGALDMTEFIVAMHLLTSTKSRAMTSLPASLPQGFYDAAARRGAPPPVAPRQASAVPRQLTGSTVGAPLRTSSPLASRPAGFGTPPPSGPAWLIVPAEKAKYDQFFSSIDTEGRGVLSGEQAVSFFGDSGLPEDTLASIWDLADINSEGQLNRDEFAVAMYLIRQQRSANAPPLPAFLPPTLVPPSMRKVNLQQQTQQTTAPAFEAVQPAIPKSAADDLFGLDEPMQPAAPAAPATKSLDPFETASPSSPSSPPRFQPVPQAGSVFKPFMPTSAFGASLQSQNTGGSQPATQPKAAPSAMDDLLGDNDAESSKLTNESTELANMSSQIGNLRVQMEETQTKKAAAQAELNTTSAQKRDLETRLQQFRTQYEQEVRAVKELEVALAQSRDSTVKLGQELALLEGGYQDLQTQHQTVAQALQADQTENASLKQKIGQLNAEVAELKPLIEKLKLEARQQKGLVSINKKQLTTNEAERDKLTGEKTELEQEAAQRVVAAEPAAREITSPAGTTMSSTNPFFRKVTPDVERSASPAAAGVVSPLPSAFDQLFGPSFASASGPPPATSFGRAPSAESLSSDGKPLPAATPPPAETRDLPVISEPPPPPLSRQFTPEQLPVGGLQPKSVDELHEVSSTAVAAPASVSGEPSDIGSERALTPAALADNVPGAFPGEKADPEADFDSAFADFGGDEPAKSGDDPFTSAFPAPPVSRGFNSEFPPIESLEHDDDDDSDSEDEVGSSQPAAAIPEASQLPKITAQTSPPPYEKTEEPVDENGFPKEFTGLLPAREDPIAAPVQEEPTTPKAVQTRQQSFPASISTSAAVDEFHDASSRPSSTVNTTAPKNAFDEFDEFEDLAEAQDESQAGSSFDFGFGHSRGASEFDAAFDSPAASTVNTVRTNTAASTSNGFSNSPFATTATSSSQDTPEAKHDWDAIFSGLDNSATGNLDTSLASDPWATSTTSKTANGHTAGSAVTPGDEHDDPILKRLTGMGYSRTNALGALEKYDYDINKAVDHLSSQ